MKKKLCRACKKNPIFVSGFCKDCLRKYDDLYLGFPEQTVCKFCDKIVPGKTRRCSEHANWEDPAGIRYKLFFLTDIQEKERTAFGGVMSSYDEKLGYFEKIRVYNRESVAKDVISKLDKEIAEGVAIMNLIDRRLTKIEAIKRAWGG